MMEKPKYLTLEFWAALVSAAVMVLVTLGVVSQEESVTWAQLATGLIAAVLPIVVLILGYGQARATAAAMGFVTEAAQQPWLTVEFWLTIIATGLMVLVATRIISQEEADVWKQLLAPLVAGVLAIVAYIRSRLEVRSGMIRGLQVR